MINLKSLLTVAFSEIKGRSSLLAASLVMSIFPFLFCFLGKTLNLTSNYDDIGLVAYGVMTCCALGFSLMVGSSILGNDLSNRRMSFYFVRPLSSLTVWGGKILGALGLVLTSSLITVLPSLILFTSSVKQFFTLDMLVNYASISIFFLGLGLVAGIVFRSRSFVLGLDLALTPITIVLGGLVFLRAATYYMGGYSLQQIGFSRNFDPIAIIISLIGLTMIIGSGVGLVVGRTDIKQVHRALSVTLWGLLSFVVLSGFSFSQWIVSASPKDITRVSESSVLPGEKWMIFCGTVWGRGNYTPTFLLNLKTQKYINLSDDTRTYVSDNGSKAIWLEQKGILSREFQLVKINLNNEDAKPIYTNISFPQPGQWQLSQDGSLAVTARQNLVTVFDVNQDKEIATINISEVKNSWPDKMIFLSHDKIRLYYKSMEKTNSVINIYDLDVTNKKATLEGKFVSAGYYAWQVTENGERILLYEGKEILNGKTGELITKLPADKESSVTAKFINENQVAIVEINKTTSNLKIFSPDKNQVEQTISLGKQQSVYIAGKLNENELVLDLCPDLNAGYYRWQVATVNIKTGVVDIKAQKVRPPTNTFWEIIKNNYASLDNHFSPYFISEKGIVKLDLTNGEQSTLTTLGVNIATE